MTVIKRNQIIVLSLAIMIVAAGYLNYTYKDKGMFSQEITGTVGERLGEATLVEQEKDNIKIGYAEPVSSTLNQKISDPAPQKAKNSVGVNNSPQTSEVISQFFEETRVERERVRDEQIALHEDVIGSSTASKEAQIKAQTQLTAISQKWEKEMIIERLIKAKGFKDAVVFINEGSVNVVVLNDGKLTTAQTAQIQDIVMREARIKVEDIKIIVK